MSREGKLDPAADGPRLVAGADLRTISTADLIEPIKAAFVDASRGTAEFGAMVFAPAGPDGDVHVKAAWSGAATHFVVKVATWFAAAEAPARATTDGYLGVHDARTGQLIAIVHDGHHLTDVRTAAAGAITLPMLAAPDVGCVGVLGTGRQARLQALAALDHAPESRLLVWGRRREAAEGLRAQLRNDRPPADIEVVGSVPDIAADADVLILATASRRPIMRGEWLRPGQHLVSVGADDPNPRTHRDDV